MKPIKFKLHSNKKTYLLSKVLLRVLLLENLTQYVSFIVLEIPMECWIFRVHKNFFFFYLRKTWCFYTNMLLDNKLNITYKSICLYILYGKTRIILYQLKRIENMQHFICCKSINYSIFILFQFWKLREQIFFF